MPTIKKVALITGAGRRRVGWHVAEALAARGHSLALHYRTARDEAERAMAEFVGRGVTAQAFGADLAREDQVQTLVESVFGRFGHVDVLVNAASIWERKSLEATTADDVRRHFDANVMGTFLISRAVGLRMTDRAEGGCVVAIGDWAEARPYLDFAAYFATKGAIPTLTRCLAVELGSRNPRVRVNAVLPGPVMLPPDLPEEERSQAINATLARREGSPINVAQAVMALIENDFITGVCLPVDGGRSIYAGGL